ncbi:hypothetical protein ACQ4PT_030699 [Festuca glaucescens]
MGRSWPWTLGLVFLASLLLLCSALPPGRGSTTELTTSADEAILARVCDPRGPRPAWCDELHLRRRFLRGVARHRHGHHHHQHRVTVPQPPPGRDDGDEIDPRYGVSKRRVPTGPNPLHN